LRTYGNLSYVPVPDGPKWAVKCEPHVAIRLKRVFGKMSARAMGTQLLTDSAENARDLEWFLERYPLEMSAADRKRLKGRAQEHRDRASMTEAMLAGRVTPRPFDLAVPLREYQKIAVEMLLNAKRVLVGDDVGLGKTAIGIGAMTEVTALPALVVTLTHLPAQWRDQLTMFAPKLRVHILRSGTPYRIGFEGAKARGGQQTLPGATPDVIIANYHKLARWAETLAGVVRYVVFDECQELRLSSSQKYSAAKYIADAAEYVCGLSATPIYNAGSEFHSVLNVIKPDALGNREEFIREWCSEGQYQRERVTDPKAFGAYVRETGLMLRRTRADVGRELPALTRVPHHIDCDLEALDQVSDACRELALFILGRGASPLKLEGDAKKGAHFLASEELSNKLRQATGIAKAPFVAEFVRLLVEQGEKVVLYGWHREVYRIWLERLENLNPVMYTGSESPKEKEAAKKAFVEGNAKVLLMSLRSGAGLDGLQEVCRTVVFGELDWAYGVHEQAEGRVQRDGQKDPVVSYYLVADTGSDPIVMDVLGIKRNQLEGLRDPTGARVEELQSDPDRIKKLAEAYLAQSKAVAAE
jgi:SNF2 family DNA or RNA helicase